MLIRREQFIAFEQSLETSFARCMLEHLRMVHAARFSELSITEGLEFVRKSIARARVCGLDDYESFSTFIELMLQFGASFPSGFGWAEQALTNFSSQSRAKALLDAAIKQLDTEQEQRSRNFDRNNAADHLSVDAAGRMEDQA